MIEGAGITDDSCSHFKAWLLTCVTTTNLLTLWNRSKEFLVQFLHESSMTFWFKCLKAEKHKSAVQTSQLDSGFWLKRLTAEMPKRTSADEGGRAAKGSKQSRPWAQKILEAAKLLGIMSNQYLSTDSSILLPLLLIASFQVFLTCFGVWWMIAVYVWDFQGPSTQKRMSTLWSLS